MRGSMSSRIRRLASSRSSTWPVSFHQPVHDVRLDPQPAVDQLLDRVGDLELVAPRRLDRARRVEDHRREHVHADQRQVRRRLLRLLDQAHDALAVQLGDAVVLRIGHRRSAGSARRARCGGRLSTRSAMPSLSRLSPRYMTNGESPRKVLGGQHRVREAARLVLLDVGDLRGRTVSRRRAVADVVAGLGRDDDADLARCRRRPSPRARRTGPACWRRAPAAWRWCG